MAEESIKFTGKIPAKILKWKVRQGSEIQRGSILCLYKAEDSELTSKFKATKGGTVLKCLVDEGNLVNSGDDLIRLQGCSHTTVMKDLCALCGANLRNASGKPGDRIENVAASVAMVHSVPELIVSEEEAKRIGREDESRLLRDRKLVLLVDLDQTLLHTTNDNVPANLKDAHHFQMWHGSGMMWYHTKFRPGIDRFLANVSKLYELHICTFGVRVYAHIIARLLDPAGQYFSHRILSRDECFNPTSKTANLKALFPCGDSMVAIIDDREDVWNFSPNLIHVKPYQFFSGTADINAPPGLSSITSDSQLPDPNRRKSRVVRVPKRKPSTAQEASHPDQDKENSEDTHSEEPKQSPESDSGVSAKKPNEGETNTPNDTGQLKEEGKGSEEISEEVSPNSDNDLDVSSSEDEGETKDTNDQRPEGLTEKKVAQSSETTNPEKLVATEEPEIKSTSLQESKTSEQNEEFRDESVTGGEEKDKSEVNVDQKDKSEVNVDQKDTSKVNVDQKDKSEDTVDQKDKSEVNVDQKDKSEVTKETVAITGQVEDKKQTGSVSEVEDVEYEEMVEWEDPDDYLLYLEEILTRIHTAFYECYDQTKNRDSNVELPSLKKIIPYVHKKVLKGTNIVFSGVFPTNMPAEKSRAHIVARALGANIQPIFVAPDANCDSEATTHVVAARPGTQKVKQARKHKKVHVVTAEWLWTCADRWERVDEQIFPLRDDPITGPPRDSPDPAIARPEARSTKRKSEENLPLYDPITGQRTQKQAKMAKVDQDKSKEGADPQPSTSKGLSAPPVLERRFSESYNPMLAFSRADIDDMDKEVEDILDASDSDEEDEDEDEEKQQQKQEKDLRRKVLNSTPDTSSEESLSADFPRGWKRKYRKKASPLSTKTEVKGDNGEEEEDPLEEEEVVDQPQRILRHSSDSDSEVQSDKESFDESIGSVDEEMAAAVEKEFLNF